MLSLVVFLGLLAAVIASAVWFFRGPAQAADRYVDSLALQLQNPQDAALFRNVYRTKDPKSTTVAWLLTAILSPTIGYIYQGKWALAVISFVTFQGFFLWWVVAIFTTPLEVLARNKRLADEAFNQVMIGRGGMGYGQGQVINVNQYAYMPHPQQHAQAPAGTAPGVQSEPPIMPQHHVAQPWVAATPIPSTIPSEPAFPPQTALTQPHPPAPID